MYFNLFDKLIRYLIRSTRDCDLKSILEAIKDKDNFNAGMREERALSSGFIINVFSLTMRS